MGLLDDLSLAVLSGRVVVTRRIPEIGVEDAPVSCLALAVRGRKLAWAVESDGAAPYRIRAIQVLEVIPAESGWLVIIDQGFPPVAMLFRPAVGEDEIASWNAAQDAAEWSDEQIASEMQTALGAVQPDAVTDLKPFDVVRWIELVGGESHPAGVMAVSSDGDGLLVEHFPGHDDEAEFWGSRFTQASADTLRTLNSSAGRTTMFSPPFMVRGTDVEDALDRALFAFAKEHYEETGRTLY